MRADDFAFCVLGKRQRLREAFLASVAVKIVVGHRDLSAEEVDGKILDLVREGFNPDALLRIIATIGRRVLSYVHTTLSCAAHRSARILVFGGLWKSAHDLRRQARRRADLPPAAGGGSFDLAPIPPQGNGRLRAHAESALLVCRARSGTQCGDPGCGDCWALHSLGHTVRLSLDDGYSEYLSGVLGLGA